MNYIVEACATSIQSAINAQIAGASRIELCENLILGGTTPSIGCVKIVRQKVKLPINVLIRPRSGDFLYSTLEFEQIKEDIALIKTLGIQGIVCGVLLANGKIDVERTRELVQLAKPLTFTFHRAFDFTPNAFEALNDVIETGATHILTSGQKNRASDSVQLITQLVEAAGNKIKIIAGGGINQNTICNLIATGTNEFHMSGATNTQSLMNFRPEQLALCGEMPDEYSIQTSSIDAIKLVVDWLNDSSC